MLDNKIYTFLALCKHMNYRLTAEELNMTQPAVTRHIQQLEAEYGCRLFIYQKRVLRKTKQAELLEAYAQSADYNSKKLIYELSGKEKKRLSIGATRTIGDYILNKEVADLIQSSDLDLTYIVDNTINLLNRLKNGNLDFVFIEGFLNKDEYAHKSFRTEALVGICSMSHPFSHKVVDISEIFTNRLILRESGSGTREAFERILFDHNLSIQSFATKIQTNSFKAITEFVAKGLGISFVYESVAKSATDCAVFRLKGVNSQHEFTCVHLKDTPKPEYFGL